MSEPDETPPRPERMPPLEPPVIWPAEGAAPPLDQAENRVLDPDDLHREPLAGHNRGIAALIAKEKAAGEQLSFVYPSKVWEYPWALSRHPVPDGEIVLDAGCGVSTLPLYLAERGATVVALDVDVRWLTMLRRAARFHDLPVVPVLGDMVGLGFPDETFDRVYCISVLEHLEVADQPTAMAEMVRVLRPGGILYLTVDYDEAERRSASDVVYDRLAMQRHAIAPSGLEVEGTTRWGVDDWPRQRERMREFKLHTFGAMGVVLRKPPAEGPRSAAAIAARRARFGAFETLRRIEVADPEALLRVDAEVAAAGARWIAATTDPRGLAEALEGARSLAAVELAGGDHAARVAATTALHDAAPGVPIVAFAPPEAVTDGALDGIGLDAYGVEVTAGEDLPPAGTVTLLRSCLAAGIDAETARAGGYCAVADAAADRR